MTAPTEAEIRGAIAKDSYSWGQFSDGFGSLIGGMDALYDTEEFRKSELAEFDSLGSSAIDAIRERVTIEITEALVAAVLTFAREHPDAPRKPQLIPA